MAAPAHGGRILTLRNRRIAGAVGLTALIHLAFLAVFALSTTQPIRTSSAWNPAFRLTLVRNPLARKRVEAKAPARSGKVERPSVATTRPPSTPSSPTAVARAPSPIAPPAAPASESDIGARLRGALHGLAACHDYGVKPTEKERRACEDRLGRLADAAPTLDAPPGPVRDGEPPQKAGTCRLNVRTLLSPRVKCKFW